MRLILTIVLVFVGVVLYAQSLPNRYAEEVFDLYSVDEEVLFSTAVPQPNSGGGFYEWISGYPLNVEEYNTSNVNLYMDIYQPTGDTLSERPVVIIAFGGGFLGGSKDHWSMQLLAQSFAKRGFVAALIDYRLGMNVFDEDLSKRAVYRGIQDGRSAVRFFRADADAANLYRIDPDHIYIGGHSSGGFIAIHNIYMDPGNDIIPPSVGEWMQDGNLCASLGCLDCAGDNQGYSGTATNVFNLAGGLGELEFIDEEEDFHPVMFHSTDDSTVPYYSGGPFSSIIWAVVGSDLPDVHGSGNMAIRMDELGLDYEFYSYTDREHEVHEDGGDALYDDILPGITDNLLAVNIIDDTPLVLNGPSTVCDDELTVSYEVTAINQGYYDWQLTNSVNSTLGNSHNQGVTWLDNGLASQVSVVPYNKLRARLPLLSMDVEVQDAQQIQAVQSGNWSVIDNWSLMRVPRQCDDVIIASGLNMFQDIPNAEVRTLLLNEGNTLQLQFDLKVLK